MYDYHVHSQYSFDSQTPMATLCEKAVELGLKGICFTDHVDFANVNWPDNRVDIPAARKEILALQERWGNQLSIAGGVEIGLQKDADQATRMYLKGQNLDFIIGSIHIADKKELYSGDFCEGMTKEAAYIRYLEVLLEEVKRQDYIHVLGHIDCVRRDERYADRSFPLSLYGELTEAVLRVLIDKGQGIEINTGSFRYGLPCTHPDLAMLKLYRQLGGTIITLGSDAHIAANVGYRFALVKDLLMAAGFPYLSYFKQGKEYRMPLCEWRLSA